MYVVVIRIQDEVESPRWLRFLFEIPTDSWGGIAMKRERERERKERIG